MTELAAGPGQPGGSADGDATAEDGSLAVLAPAATS